MSKKELMDKIGYKEGDLINTNKGYMGILQVTGNKVSIGFLSTGNILEVALKDLLAKFDGIEKEWLKCLRNISMIYY